MRSRVILLVVGAMLLTPGASAKKKTLKLLIAGASCYENLNYGCAIDKLVAAQARVETEGITLDTPHAMKLCETLAFALASVEKHKRAVAAFARCLALQPSYRLDPKVISPKLYRDYQTARRTMLDRVTTPTPRLPQLPKLYPIPPPDGRDYRVHTPDYLTLSGMHEQETLRHDLDFLVGASLLFGGDGENYRTGFAAAVQYLYAVHRLVELQGIAQFSTHNYAGDDAKAGFPATLYTVNLGFGARVRVGVGDYVVLSAGLLGGLSMAGLGSVDDRIGGFVAGTATVTIRPIPEFGVGVTVIPTLVLAELEEGDIGKSLVLPIFLRLAAYF